MVHPAGHSGLDGTDRDAETIGDLSLRQVLEVGQFQGLSLLVDQRVQAAAHVSGPGEPFDEHLAVLPHEVAQLTHVHHHILSSSELVNGPIACDAQGERDDAARRIEASSRPPQLEERLLNNVLTVVTRHESSDVATNQRTVASIALLEGSLVARSQARGEFVDRRRGAGQLDLFHTYYP